MPDDNEEAEEFKKAVSDVTPLKPHNVTERRRTAPISPTQKKPDPKRSTSQAETDDDFVRDGIQRKVLQKLRNGKIPIESELDLHGYNATDAEREVQAFVSRSRFAGRQRAVRIIHGKGLRSPNSKSVLKDKVRDWLRGNDAVLAYCRAPLTGGGSGAVHVLLKKR